MNIEVIGGILIPFVGTTLGAAGVFFMKKQSTALMQRIFLGFAAGVMIAASVWSLLIPAIEETEQAGGVGWLPASGDGSVRRDGTTGIHPGCGGLLDRKFIFTGSGSYHSSSAP